ncbi:MAG TPA: ribosome-associated translation inhibitor RaiA [Gammaproteobacteria bacterium]|nr:ribosome-associated translation inhibitor RaiA [Gammaproteobacteria bacterium]
MQMHLTGHHVEITPALRNYVETKFSRLERHFEHLYDIHVVLTIEKLLHKAEATVQVNGNTLHADAAEEDMYAAIDLLIDKIDRQVIKHKEKLRDHHQREVKPSVG